MREANRQGDCRHRKARPYVTWRIRQLTLKQLGEARRETGEGGISGVSRSSLREIPELTNLGVSASIEASRAEFSIFVNPAPVLDRTLIVVGILIVTRR